VTAAEQTSDTGQVPWKTRNALDQRNDFITEWLKGGESFTELCRICDISRKTGYKWVERFQEKGRSGLAEQSRAPHSSPQAIKATTARAIVAKREERPRWGARKLRESLERVQPTIVWPASSSIGELLKREGLIQERVRRRKTPPYTEPLAHAEEPNDVWCADFKGWFHCGDGTRCDPFTVTDARSRYLLCCRDTAKTDGLHVRAIMEATFRNYGLPSAMRTDNGSPFASRAPAGLSRLSMWWLQLGIRHERIEPGRPEQNGRHERMHRTLKEETASPPAANRRRQQQAFIAFGRMYNEERPHEALNGKTPGDVYTGSIRSYPSRMPELVYPPGVHLRRISQQGSLKWRTERTFLSEVLARQTVGLLETEEEFYEVYYGPLLIGWFDARSHVFEPERPQPQRAKRGATA
jgi:transposase InsO family protein